MEGLRTAWKRGWKMLRRYFSNVPSLQPSLKVAFSFNLKFIFQVAKIYTGFFKLKKIN